MRSDEPLAASHVDRVPSTPERRTVLVSIAGLLGLGGVVLFGIGLVEVWGGIWSALGFVACVAVVAVSGFDLAPSGPQSSAPEADTVRPPVKPARADWAGLVSRNQ